MKQSKLLIFFLAWVSVGFAQWLSLEECFQLAEKNHPMMKQKTPINEITKNQLTNINMKWLPTLDINLSSTYQSDVTSININLPPTLAGTFEIPSPDQDNYKSEIEINQLVFDGGLISVQKELAKQDNKISLQQLEVSFQSIKSSITYVFYNLLLLDAQKIILETWLADLENSKEIVNSLIANGLAEGFSLYEIEIKIHELQQQIDENKIYRQNNLEILGELIGEKIDDDILMYVPKDIDNQEIMNAQSQLFDYQRERLNIARKVTFCNRMPKIFSFGRIGYSKPGLNMLSAEVDSYYLVGVGLKWNIWDWKTNKRDREKLQFNQKIIEYTEEAYNQKTKIELDKYQSSISNLAQKITKDEVIIELHRKLKTSAESKFKNGIMNTTDYLKYSNDLIRSQLAMEVHHLQLFCEKVNYQILKGEL
ncbi:MAG: TolC family protein [Candidatus Marinimicrobia bacterium]|nr:TolC family protein [Candidatus Neomarinimicrobiota bacterium]